MNATVHNLAAYRAQRRQTTSTEDRVTQAVMNIFEAWPAVAVGLGIEAARIDLRCDGSFLTAMDKAEKTIYHACPYFFQSAIRNTERTTAFYRKREQRIAALIEVVDRNLRDRLAHLPEREQAAAIEQAYIVIERGGTLDHAMQQAMNNRPEHGTC